ncbi:hypothetical protein GSU68_18460 (plasmid) [Rathayibacter sp. VKM Ac-2759]|uniref:hypothetical protein n=1 Tax=Rathayibacter sp. VKM Ac-2759 TaxID=2609252 RepID=UPI0013193756|nr:hypothetical protein [Rathayibacter sp. VKM Ac-2759]QHC68693.1 hypothetical protein GSU68_18460 [Rathayibacter sp. VKM Ac-2759]
MSMPETPRPAASIMPERLSAHLLVTAQDAAREVLTGYTTDEPRELLQRLFDAGSVVEHLVKAAVARIHPSLLADRTHAQSVLTLAGVALSPPLSVTELRTISYTEAMKLLVLAQPVVARVDTDAKALVAGRNAAAHMGLVNRAVVETFAQDLVRVVGVLLPLLDTSKEEFWSAQWLPIAKALELEKEDRSRARVASKIARARLAYLELIDGFDESNRESTLRLLERRLSEFDFFGMDLERLDCDCPACGRSGWLTCERELRWQEAKPTREEMHGVSTAVPIDLIPLAFECPVCGLALDGSQGELVVVEAREVIRSDQFEYVSDSDSRLWGTPD